MCVCVWGGAVLPLCQLRGAVAASLCRGDPPRRLRLGGVRTPLLYKHRGVWLGRDIWFINN